MRRRRTVGAGPGGSRSALPTKNGSDGAMNDHPEVPDAPALTDAPPRTRTRTPRDDLFDSLIEHFGSPRTKTEQSMFGKVVRELLEAGATSEETANACSYVLRNFDSPSVFAVVKWFSVSQNEKPRLSGTEAMLDEIRRNGK